MDQGNADARIHDAAARQHGVVTRGQLLRGGLSRGAIEHRLKKGTLRRLHYGVYCAGPVAAHYQREMAAALACGPAAALSHRTAGGLWAMMPAPQREAPVEVTGPRSLRGPASGVRLYRMELEPDEITLRHRLPVTTPARTVLDLASGLGPDEMERILARAVKQKLVTCEAVEAMLLRHPRRPGCRTLRALLADAVGPAFVRSEAETGFLALLRKAGVPRPRSNVVVHGLEVDFFWPDRGLVAEVDGFAHHSHRSAFENDRRRDHILAAEGLVVLRFTWRQIHREPEKVVARLCMALGARAGGQGGGYRGGHGGGQDAGEGGGQGLG